MFFTRVAAVGAWIALALGAFRIAIALFIATGIQEAEAESVAASRYLGSKTTGEAIDQGLMVIVFAVALGTLAEISRSVRKQEY